MHRGTDHPHECRTRSRHAFALAIVAGALSTSSLTGGAETPPPRIARSAVVTVVGLETNAAAEPLGIDDPAPRLSWRLQARRRGVQQSAYRVLVATSTDKLREGIADVWDSGVVGESAELKFGPTGRPAVRTRVDDERLHRTRRSLFASPYRRAEPQFGHEDPTAGLSAEQKFSPKPKAESRNANRVLGRRP